MDVFQQSLCENSASLAHINMMGPPFPCPVKSLASAIIGGTDSWLWYKWPTFHRALKHLKAYKNINKIIVFACFLCIHVTV